MRRRMAGPLSSLMISPRLDARAGSLESELPHSPISVESGERNRNGCTLSPFGTGVLRRPVHHHPLVSPHFGNAFAPSEPAYRMLATNTKPSPAPDNRPLTKGGDPIQRAHEDREHGFGNAGLRELPAGLKAAAPGIQFRHYRRRI